MEKLALPLGAEIGIIEFVRIGGTNMEEFSRETLNTALTVLKRLRDQSETEGFINEKRIIENCHMDGSENIQLLYAHLLSRIEEEIKCSNRLHE